MPASEGGDGVAGPGTRQLDAPRRPPPATEPEPSAADPAPPAPLRVRNRVRVGRADLAAAAGYLLLAVWVTGRLWAGIGERRLTAHPYDHAFFEWVYAHGARVVTKGVNPLFTTQLNAPDGVNMMANNSQLGLTVPLAPVTVLFGAHVSVAVALTASLAAASYGWYHVLSRHLVASRPAAFIGGAICGFGPGLMSHVGGQLNMVTNALIPFIVWRTLALRQPGRAVRNGVLLGLLVAYQVFVAEEPLLIAALGVAAFIGFHAVLHPAQARAAARPFLTGLGVAAAVAGTLLAYPLYFQFFGPQHYRGIMEVAASYSANFPSYTGRRLSTLAPAPYGQDALTWPLTAVTIVVGVVLWRQVRALLLTSLLFAVLALGPRVQGDSAVAGFPLPFLPLSRLPVFDALVPARLQLVCMVIAGVLLAIGWDRLAARPRRGAWAPVRRLGFVTAVLLLVPALPVQAGAAPAAEPPPFVTDGIWRRYVPPGRTLVPLPVPQMSAVEWMRWSAATRLDIALPGGYFFGPASEVDKRAWYWPAERPTTTLARQVLGGGPPPVTDDLRGTVLADLRHWRAAAVVIIPSERTIALRGFVTGILGQPQDVGGVWVWDVRELV
jgi:hypothetical protein